MRSLRLSAPGSGKTTKILKEAREVLENGGRAWLTAFGKKNVKDFRQKIGWLPEAQKERLLISTIHAEAFHFLKARPETNLTVFLFENDSKFGLHFGDKAKKQAGATVEGMCLIDDGTEDDMCYAEVQRLRARGLTYRDTTFCGSRADRVKHVWDILEEGFKRGFWDFMWLLEEADRRGLTFKADYVAVDEINDLTPLQCRIVARSEGARVVFCGDLNQSIYSFAGVCPDAILALPHDVVEYQNESYRLTTEVAEYAGKVLSRIKEPYGKKIVPLAGEGTVLKDNSFRNVLQRLPAFGDAMILGRTNYIVDQARRVAIDAGANVVMSENDILQADLCSLIKEKPPTFPLEKLECALGSWLPSGRFWKYGAKKALRDHVTKSSSRWMPWTKLFEEYGTPDLKRVFEGDLSWYAGRPEFDPTKPLISFFTSHTSKGMEEKNVVVLRDVGSRVWEGMDKNRNEEIRLSYVMVTRAKQRLIISQLDSVGYGNPYLGGG